MAKRPSSQVVDDLNEALRSTVWGEEALIAALRETDLQVLQEYVEQFWGGASAEALIFGNYTGERVDQVSMLLGELLGSEPAPSVPQREILKLAAGESLPRAPARAARCPVTVLAGHHALIYGLGTAPAGHVARETTVVGGATVDGGQPATTHTQMASH